ncbi:MAG: response regulator transcription factor [Burkholderiales bacterium]|jgi:DNA-binding LytR/AlgR family response regulator|nr:response regulator transcription factor [Burkholderiales bacterium]
MRSLSVILADDDREQLRYLQDLIHVLRPHWTVIAALDDITSLPALIQSEQPSLCILDVGFEDTNGIDTVRNIPSAPPIIYVTGDPSAAVRAFDTPAIDFIVKPIRRDRFEQALERAEKQVGLLAAERSQAERSDTSRVVTPTMVRMMRGEDLMIVSLDEVRYFQADRKYTRVVLQSQEGMLRMSLYAIEPYINADHFWRIHRGCIINARRVSLAKRDDLGRLFIRVQDRPESLPVARPYEYLFKDGFS